MSFVKKISPLNIDSFANIGGRGENILFYQGGISESWRNCIFSQCRYELINFADSEITGSTFNSSEFHKTNFKNSVLNQLSFNFCTLVSSSFEFSSISNSSFQNCILDNCSFNKSKLKATNFYLSQLSYCKFQGADLSDTNLDQAKSLFGCEFDQFTKLPFSEKEAYAKGMVYAPQLILVNESNKSIDNIINFPTKSEVVSFDVISDSQVINFVDYVKLKNLNTDGPKSA